MQITQSQVPGKSLGSEWQCVNECLQLDAMPIYMYNLFCHNDVWLLKSPPSRVLYICKFTCIIQDLTHSAVVVTWYVFRNRLGISTPMIRWILSDRLTQLSDFLSTINIHVRNEHHMVANHMMRHEIPMSVQLQLKFACFAR